MSCKHAQTPLVLVSLAAVFSIVTQRSSPPPPPPSLRDDTKNGCEGDYSGVSLCGFWWASFSFVLLLFV